MTPLCLCFDTPYDYIETKLIYDSIRLLFVSIILWLHTAHPQLNFLQFNYMIMVSIFTIPAVFTVKFYYVLLANKSCENILRILKKLQKMTMIYYPVDLAVRCYLSWLLGHDLRRFPVEAGFMAFGMIWEIFFYRVILRMIEWEKAGELYYFDNHGQRVFDGNPVENSFEFVYISDSVEVKVQQAWPALEVCYEYGKVLPPNLEIEVKDFTVKPQGGNDE